MKNLSVSLLLLFSLVLMESAAQTLSIDGVVTDRHEEGIPGVTVSIKGSIRGTSTDNNGRFTIKNISDAPFTLLFSSVGYEDQEKQINNSTSVSKLHITLKESTTELRTVQVLGKSETAEIREQPYAVSVIDVKPLQIQNLDINQVLNTVSGVRIREEGGLGSNFNFSLNGFTGKQVRFFMDGIPMESFGSSLTMNNIPVNLISNIEIYKGVVPVHLATDALGGVVNISTNQNVSNYVNASYAIGSFNTHRTSVLSRFTESNTGFTINANLFFNYSDNDYKMYNMEVPKPDGTGRLDTVNVNRFHDAYQSQTAQIEIGIIDKPYADRLFIGLIASGNKKEVQNGYNMQNVYGQVRTTNQIFIPTLKYKKSDLLIRGLDLSGYATYTIQKGVRIDSSSRIYNWYGDYTIRTNNAGEFTYNKSLLTLQDKSSTAGMNFSYAINEQHSFSVNHLLSTYTRIGKDALRDASEVPFTHPNSITKNVSAIGYSTSLFNDKWRTSVFAKVFIMDANTQVENKESGLYEDYIIHFTNKGFGLASTYFFTKWLQLKLSYENTYRLPEGEEMFGDGLFVKPYTELRPEQSNNYNAGILINKIFTNHSIQFESNYLYRDASDFIRIDASNPINSVYKNQKEVLLSSIEAGFKYSYKRFIHVQGNFTKQQSINNDKENRLYKDKLPNQPYLFGNIGLGLQFHDVVIQDSKLSINWFTLFVDQFYWKWPSQGTKKYKYDIPQQLWHDVSVSYLFGHGRYSTSLACTNITNALRFDNFALQKPGRAFSLKLNYYLSE